MWGKVLSVKRRRKKNSTQNTNVPDEEVAIFSTDDGLTSTPQHQNNVDNTNDNIEDYDDLSFIVDYIGSDYISEAKSEAMLLDSLKRIKKHAAKSIRVDFIIKNGVLKITECDQGSLLLTAPSYAVALCARDEVPGFETTFGLNITRRRIHMCHVFQAESELEVYSITRAIALSFRCVGRDLRKIETLTTERLRADSSEGSRARSDTLDREFESVSRRHNPPPGGFLPTVRSEDDLTTTTPSNHVNYESDHSQACSSTSTPGEEEEPPTSLQLSFAEAVCAIKRHDVRKLLRCLDKGETLLLQVDKHNDALLHHAVMLQKEKIIRILLKRGADVNIEGHKDQTPLHMAASLGHRTIAKTLLEYGANVRARDRSYQTPLHLCAGSMQKLELSFLLMEHGARIDDNDLEGVRPSDINKELREMQNRLIQSSMEAFALLDVSARFSTDYRRSVPASPVLPRKVHATTRVQMNATPQKVRRDTTESEQSVDIQPLQSSIEPLVDLYTDLTEDSEKETHHENHHIMTDTRVACTKDPVTEALQLLLNLSANSECHSTLLANICLPKPAGQLVSIAHSTRKSNLQQIAKLLTNLFNVGGAKSRQRCITTGLLKIVVDLLGSPEPLQSACLSILNDVLQQDGDRDYSQTISGIQVQLLLTIISDDPQIKPSASVDSGYRSPMLERRPKNASFHRDETEMPAARTGSLKTRQNTYLTTEVVGRGRSESLSLLQDNSLGRYSSASSMNHGSSREFDGSSMKRTAKLSTGSAELPRSIDRPIARHVAMKMLASSSRNSKLQDELTKAHMLNFLLDCLNDCDQEVVLHAALAVANISFNVEKHERMQEQQVEAALYKHLHHSNPRIKYQCARALVYMGHLDLDGVYIYNYLPDEDSSPTSIEEEEEGHLFLRGTSVENLVLTLTTSYRMLWGKTAAKSKGRTSAPTEYQIIEFIIKIYQTFVHPVIFMRLLLHRFHEPNSYGLFVETAEGHTKMEHYAPLPEIHARLMRVWIAWIELAPDDFKCYTTIKDELCKLITPMRAIDGPYAPCAEKLENLFVSVESYQKKNIYLFPPENHHNVLYEQWSKAVREGCLPCAEDDFVYLAGLQLYIEDLRQYGRDFPQRLHTIKSINSSRLKHSIGPQASSSKTVAKKIRANYEEFVVLQQSERNAKHNYVDCCQGMPGYGCKFFKVKQRVLSTRRNKSYVTRLFGVSEKRLVIVDERSKACTEKFASNELRHWKPVDDKLVLQFCVVNNADKLVELQIDNRVRLKELSNEILTCTMANKVQGYENIDTNPWSRLAEECGTWGGMALQVHVSKKNQAAAKDVGRQRSITTTNFPGSSSITSDYSKSAPVKQESGWNAVEALSFLNLKSRLRSRGDTVLSVPCASEEGTPPSELTSRLHTVSSNTSFELRFQRAPSNVLSMSSIGDKVSLLDESPTVGEYPSSKLSGGRIGMCHCPPDAETPNINLREFSAYEVLEHPRELARQITLIDHEMFCDIGARDVLHKINLGHIKKLNKQQTSRPVEKVAQRFNQLSNWIAFCVVSESSIMRRAKIFVNFVETAKQCLEFCNYNAVMAIVCAGLGSAPVRRLSGTREVVGEEVLSCLNKMETLMESRRNFKRYRKTIRTSPTPAVPYFGLYLKDLTFICDGNANYLRGGIVNLSKRKQVYTILEEMQRFQRKIYNFQEVSEIKDYLLSKSLIADDQLMKMSKEIEPTISSTSPPPLRTMTQPLRHTNSNGVSARKNTR